MTEAIMRDEIQAQRETDAYRRGKLATAQSIERMLRELAKELEKDRAGRSDVTVQIVMAALTALADQIRKEYGL